MRPGMQIRGIKVTRDCKMAARHHVSCSLHGMFHSRSSSRRIRAVAGVSRAASAASRLSSEPAIARCTPWISSTRDRRANADPALRPMELFRSFGYGHTVGDIAPSASHSGLAPTHGIIPTPLCMDGTSDPPHCGAGRSVANTGERGTIAVCGSFGGLGLVVRADGIVGPQCQVERGGRWHGHSGSMPVPIDAGEFGCFRLDAPFHRQTGEAFAKPSDDGAGSPGRRPSRPAASLGCSHRRLAARRPRR